MVAEAEDPPAAAEPKSEPAPPRAHFEIASTGRSKCRACGTTIAKGEVRLGDKHPNPFAEGETTYWFHPTCAAYRRPESFLVALGSEESTDVRPADAESLTDIARPAAEHPRLARVSRLEMAPSGRARCRHCRQAIPKEGWRLSLEIFQDGRFDPIGFIHLSCQRDYFGTDAELARILRVGPELDPEQQTQVQAGMAPASE